MEEQIVELESKVKFFKQSKDAWVKPYLEEAEGELKALKELQKKARPLPARLQAAADRCAKYAAASEAGSLKVDELRDQLAKAEEELADVIAKETEAQEEYKSVAELAAVGGTISVVGQVADFVTHLLGSAGLNLDDQVLKQLREQIAQRFMAPVPPPGIDQQKGARAAAADPSQVEW